MSNASSSPICIWITTAGWRISRTPKSWSRPVSLRLARGLAGRMRGYLPHRWPAWFDPVPLHLGPKVWPLCAKPAADGSRRCRRGCHAGSHRSIIFRSSPQDGDTAYFLAGDTWYDERLMLAGKLDGVSADEQVCTATLDAIRRFTQSRPTVYLPTHDPQAAGRLAKRQLAGAASWRFFPASAGSAPLRPPAASACPESLSSSWTPIGPT